MQHLAIVFPSVSWMNGRCTDVNYAWEGFHMSPGGDVFCKSGFKEYVKILNDMKKED